jgi:hypothetical protein
MSTRMTKEYRLRKAVASLMNSLEVHGDHLALFSALRSVHPEAASRLAKACANSEAAAGQLLGMGMSHDAEFSLLDRLLTGNPSDELPRLERWMAKLSTISSSRLEASKP